MGLLSRFINVIRSNINALLNSAEDPAKMLEQTLVDMEAAFRKAKEHVARSVADKKRLEKSLMDQQAQVRKYEQGAVKAVESGDDDLAREALRRKNEHAKIAVQFEQELGAHSINVDRLKESLKELEHRIDELRRRKNLLLSKQKRAEAQDQIYRSIEGIEDAGGLDTIQRMENKIEEMSALADARHDLQQESAGADLDKRLESLGAGSGNVDDELLELKQRMQIENKPGA